MISINSLNQDLEIRYYAMMSRIVQFARKDNAIRNIQEIKIPRHNPEIADLVSSTTNLEKKSIQGAATA